MGLSLTIHKKNKQNIEMKQPIIQTNCRIKQTIFPPKTATVSWKKKTSSLNLCGFRIFFLASNQLSRDVELWNPRRGMGMGQLGGYVLLIEEIRLTN